MKYQRLVPEAHQLLEQFRWGRLLMLHSVLNFPENEGDSQKLKKLQALVQHFSNGDIMY